MKIKILNTFSYQSYPEVEGMIEIDDNDLEQLGITTQFDVNKQCIIPYDNSADIKQEQDEQRKAEIKERLLQLNEDAIQVQMGEIVPDWEKKQKEFISLHNELRVLEGKAPRDIK